MVHLWVVLGIQLVVSSLWANETNVNQVPSEKIVVCENRDQKDLEKQFDELRKSLENGFQQGLPAQLRGELVKSRETSDDLTLQVLDTHIENEQEINGLVKKMLDHLDEFIVLVPKVSNHAPKVRDEFVIPFSNVSSLRSETKECFVAEVDQNSGEIKETATETTNINKFALITDELNRLNHNLYEAQTISPQKYLSYKAELQEMIEKYNNSRDLYSANQIKSRVPEILNNMQTEIDVLLPGFQLSTKYMAVVGL